jgi:LAGLIDADG DNA endonuclease family protein
MTIPVTTQGLRSLDGAIQLHNTPALINLMDLASYISGFVDGEGCFCVSFQPSRRHKFGWEVRPSFSVSQNADRAELLYVIQNRWACGFIRPDRSDKTIKFEVRNVQDLVEKVLPHFRAYPLTSSKQRDVERFAEICRIIHESRHLEERGLSEIVEIAMAMNPSGKRKYQASDILKSLGSGERIVYAAGNRGSP